MSRCVHCGTFEADLTPPNVMLEMRDDEGIVYHICQQCEDAEHESEEPDITPPESLFNHDVQDEEHRQWFADPAEPVERSAEDHCKENH